MGVKPCGRGRRVDAVVLAGVVVRGKYAGLPAAAAAKVVLALNVAGVASAGGGSEFLALAQRTRPLLTYILARLNIRTGCHLGINQGTCARLNLFPGDCLVKSSDPALRLNSEQEEDFLLPLSQMYHILPPPYQCFSNKDSVWFCGILCVDCPANSQADCFLVSLCQLSSTLLRTKVLERVGSFCLLSIPSAVYETWTCLLIKIQFPRLGQVFTIEALSNLVRR